LLVCLKDQCELSLLRASLVRRFPKHMNKRSVGIGYHDMLNPMKTENTRMYNISRLAVSKEKWEGFSEGVFRFCVRGSCQSNLREIFLRNICCLDLHKNLIIARNCTCSNSTNKTNYMEEK
jgi:hypothetical protein